MSRNNCQRPSIPLDSKEDVREYLIVHRILSKETARSPKKMNIALVEECYAYLQDVSGTGPVLDAAALDAKYLEIVSTAKRQVAPQPEIAPLLRGRRGRQVRRFLIALAAALVLLFGTLTVVAKVQGYSHALNFVTEKFIEIFRRNTGEPLEGEGITLTLNTERITYSSVQELLENEAPEVLYPTALPEGLKVVSASKHCYDDTRFVLTFNYEVPTFSFMVKNTYAFDLSVIKDPEIYDFGPCRFFVMGLHDGTYQAVCQYDGYEYLIIHNNHDELIQILESMKGGVS